MTSQTTNEVLQPPTRGWRGMEVRQIIDTDKIDYTDMTCRLTDCWTFGNSCWYNSNESNQMGID